jgi:glycosyltransferase involved in cell wall biosynthesis
MNIFTNINEVFKIVLVGHDCHPHGSQMLLLNLAKTLQKNLRVKPVILVLGEGKLLSEYQKICDVFLVKTEPEINEVLKILTEQQFNLAITNTVVSGWAVPYLKANKFKVLSLIHELPRIITAMNLKESAEKIAKFSDYLVFPDNYVKEKFESVVSKFQGKVLIQPQGLYTNLQFNHEEGNKVRENLGIKATTKVAINVGYAALNKGFDLFVQLARLSKYSRSDWEFIWVGHISPELNLWLNPSKNEQTYLKNLHMVGFTEYVERYLSAADVFVLTSREDSFPTVLLEALNVGLPVVAMKNSGGFVELFEKNKTIGKLVDYEDTLSMLKAMKYLTTKNFLIDKNKNFRERRSYIEKNYNFSDYVHKLCNILQTSI